MNYSLMLIPVLEGLQQPADGRVFLWPSSVPTNCNAYHCGEVELFVITTYNRDEFFSLSTGVSRLADSYVTKATMYCGLSVYIAIQRLVCNEYKI